MSLEHGRPTDGRSRSGDRLLPWPEVERIVPYTRMHIGRLESAGKFPRRVQIGANRVGWWQSEIWEWAATLPRGPLQVKRSPPEAA